MKKTIRRTIALLVCFTMMLTFSACKKSADNSSSETTATDSEKNGVLMGFDDDGEDNQDAAAGDNTQSGTSGDKTGTGAADGNTIGNADKIELDGKDPFASIPKNLKGTTVTFAHFGDEGAAEYQKVCKAFTKKTGIKVNLVSFNQGEYVSLVAKQIANKAGPDVIICNTVFPSALQIAQPLQSIIDLNDEFWDKEISDLTTVGGNTYFVNSLNGVWENSEMTFYNKKLFSDNGLNSPSDYYHSKSDGSQWTYENLRKCLEQIKQTGNTGGFCDGSMLATSLGQPMIKYDPKTATFSNNNANLLKAYQFTAQINKDGLWSDTAYWATFSNGTIGLYMSSLYGAKYNGFFKDMDDNSIAAVPNPSSYQGTPCKATSTLRGYGIAKGAKNPQGAVYFLRYYLDYSYYKDAGANVFKNSALEKVYFNEVVPQIKKTGRVFDMSFEPMNLVDNGNIGLFMADVRTADPAQVSAELAKKNNIIENAVNKGNEKIAAYR